MPSFTLGALEFAIPITEARYKRIAYADKEQVFLLPQIGANGKKNTGGGGGGGFFLWLGLICGNRKIFFLFA
jgi:hypothetical protein